MLTIDDLFHQSLNYHRDGNSKDAMAGYREVLAMQADHAMANYNLGMLYMQLDAPGEGLPFLSAALDIDPTHGQFWLSYIVALAKDGQIDAARTILDLAKKQGLEGPEVEELTSALESVHEQPHGYCPVCGDKAAVFLPLPKFYKEQSLLHGFEYFGAGEMISLDRYACRRCGASDRERIYALWIDAQIKSGSLSAASKVIHFAPEPALSRKLRAQFPNYTTADFSMAQVDHRVDLQSLPFQDESYDFFICSHVLEHVDSDDDAIRELYRITRDGGCGILVAPVIVGLAATLEDPSVTDAAGRWRLYGQDDHVRLYAHDDYVNKIRSHGFKVEELGEAHFGQDIFSLLGLTPTSILYVVSK